MLPDLGTAVLKYAILYKRNYLKRNMVLTGEMWYALVVHLVCHTNFDLREHIQDVQFS